MSFDDVGDIPLSVSIWLRGGLDNTVGNILYCPYLIVLQIIGTIYAATVLLGG